MTYKWHGIDESDFCLRCCAKASTGEQYRHMARGWKTCSGTAGQPGGLLKVPRKVY